MDDNNIIQIAVAEALYDNVSEWPDELAFGKGDLLRVIDDRPNEGSDGWWLCVDEHGQRGLAPANRLRVMHRFDTSSATHRTLSNAAGDSGLINHRVITPSSHQRIVADPYAINHHHPFHQQQFARFFSSDSAASLLDALPSLSLLHGILLYRCNYHFVAGPERAFPLSPAERFTVAGGSSLSSSPSSSQRSSSLSDRSTTNGNNVVRNIPIRIENASHRPNGVGDLTMHRGSPPPPQPPQRKYFHLLTPPATASSGSSEEETKQQHMNESTDNYRRNTSTKNTKRSLSPKTLANVAWRLTQLATPLANSNNKQQKLLPQTTNDQRASTATSSASLSERSSLSDDTSSIGSTTPLVSKAPSTLTLTARSSTSTLPLSTSSVSLYDVPSRLLNTSVDVPPPAPTVTRRTSIDSSKPPVAPKPTPMMRNRSKLEKSTSVLQNVLEGLYDHLPTTATADRPAATDAASVVKSARDSLIYDIPRPADESKPVTMTNGHHDIHKTPHKSGNTSSQQMVLDRLRSHQHKLEHCAQKMTGYTAPRFWRQPHILQQNLVDIREIVVEVATALGDFVDTTARLSVDYADTQSKQLTQLLAPLRDSKALVTRLKQTLDATGWTLAALSRPRHTTTTGAVGNDALDQFVAVSKQIPKDCHQLMQWATNNAASIRFILVENPIRMTQTSTTTMQLPIATTNGTETCVYEEDDLESIASDRDDLFNDYAYVDGNSKQVSVNNGHHESSLSVEDRQLMRFYAPQVDAHAETLSTAIEDFLTSIEDQRSARDFVQTGKLVILAAHKLVYIGDNMAQCLAATTLSTAIRAASDRLCSVLKECVTVTKTAADQYPCMDAIQSMVDGVVAVSHAAHELKLIVVSA